MNNQFLLKARVPHNYVLWVASHFHPAMHKTKKVLPCQGKRYCFVIDGVPCTQHWTQTSHGFFFFPGGYRNNNGTYNNIVNNGNWLSSTDNDSNNAWNLKLNYNNSNVNRYNNALAFYQKLGYEILKEEDIDIGEGFFMNDFVMLKDV
jgi:hypothetical protein